MPIRVRGNNNPLVCRYINVTLFDLPHEVMPYSASNPRRVPRKSISVHKVSPSILMQIYRKIHLELQPHKLLANSDIPGYLLDQEGQGLNSRDGRMSRNDSAKMAKELERKLQMRKRFQASLNSRLHNSD